MTTTEKKVKKEYIRAVGRRKTATAVVRLHKSTKMSYTINGKEFVDYFKTADLRNVLIFHGDQDKTVPLENGYILYNNAKSPKKIIVLKDGDHQMSNIDDQMLFEIEVLEWLENTFK